jgi:hypothetical protein
LPAIDQIPEKSDRRKNEKWRKTQEHSDENHSFNRGIPEDNWRIRASILNQKHEFDYTNLGFVDLSQENLGEGKPREEERK